MAPTEQEPVALITGSARRIGAVLASGLHEAGYRVLVHYRRSRSAAEQLAEKLQRRRPDSVALLQGDLACPHVVRRLAAEAVERWGRLDVLINNASDFFPGALEEVNEQDWELLLASNLKGPFFMSQALAMELRRRRGAILNMLDTHALHPLAGYSVYCASKAGLAMLTRSLARELAPQVRVNGLAPGMILPPSMLPRKAKSLRDIMGGDRFYEERDWDDSMRSLIQRIPLQRPGSPEDILQAALFLLHHADYTTGQILQVDGGRLL